MGFLFKKSDKEILSIRNKIFTEVGVPALEKNGFSKSPFSGSWFGRNNLRDYTYELVRVSNNSQLEYIITHISKGDRPIKIFLNVFQLSPRVNYIEELIGIDGIEFKSPSNQITAMQLRSDDYKGTPLFYMLFCPEHKIGRYYSERGFNKEVEKLSRLIKKDMTNIDRFVKRWHEIHTVNQTDWEGNRIS